MTQIKVWFCIKELKITLQTLENQEASRPREFQIRHLRSTLLVPGVH